ncbi:transposable element Tcb2 transposase [Trichonephila clavipes]|nr:transposable element Tcb2 transposase [Trichonephila clavipes]
MTAQRYVYDNFILQLHLFPLMQRPPTPSFQQDSARPLMARVSQDCLCTVTILPCPARSPDLSPIEPILDHVGWRAGRPTSLNEIGKVTTNMEQNVSRHHTELVCLNARSYRIVHLC